MGRFLTVRRGEWLPGLAILLVSVALGILLGSAVQMRSWASYLGLVTALVLLFGWLEGRRDARPPSSARRRRSQAKVGDSGHPAKYDLSKDDTTDSQKYVM